MRLMVFLFVIGPFVLYSQNDSNAVQNKKHKVELSLNITTTLSNSLGNNTSATLLADPYLVGIKFQVKNNCYTRVGFNIKARSASENFGQRDVLENDYRVRVGMEWRIPVTKKIFIYPGADLIGGYNYSDVRTFDGMSRTQISSSQTAFGGGPIMGFGWQLNKRVALSTEAAIYYQATLTHRRLDLGFPNPSPTETTVAGYILNPVIPSSLYITIIF